MLAATKSRAEEGCVPFMDDIYIAEMGFKMLILSASPPSFKGSIFLADVKNRFLNSHAHDYIGKVIHHSLTRFLPNVIFFPTKHSVNMLGANVFGEGFLLLTAK